MSTENDTAYYARKFAEWIISLSRDGVEIYKHELRANADLLIERIETAQEEVA